MTRRLALASMAALSFTASLRPWGSGYLAVVAFAAAVAAVRGERRPARAAALMAVAWLGLAVPALEGTFLSVWWSLPALVALNSVAWAVAGAAHAFAANRGGGSTLWLLPLLVVAAEFVASRRWLWGDAAFSLLAYTQADTPLRYLASLTGSSGPALGVALAGGALVALVTGPRWTAGALLVSIATLSLAAYVVPAGTDAGSVRVAVVQSAQGQVARLLMPFDEGLMARVVAPYVALTAEAAAAGAELVVWGETVLPEGSAAVEGPWVNALRAAPAVVAGRVERAVDGLYNSVFAWRGDGLELVSRKQALVPVVEAVYAAGEPSEPFSVQGARLAALVCLDSLHGELSRESVRRGADLLVYLTDDTFAGRTATPLLHLRTAILRAAETGRAVVFANESGPSAIVSPTGKVLALSRAREAGVVITDVPLMRGSTPYVAFGDWLGTLALSAVLAVLALTARRPPCDVS